MAAKLTDAERHKRNTDALKALETKLRTDQAKFKADVLKGISEEIALLSKRIDTLEETKA